MNGFIRIYSKDSLIIFSQTCGKASETPPPPFPDFTTQPDGLHVFSYQQVAFAPPQFKACNTSTPWLLFDDRANALVISPATHFMVASMLGDGLRKTASGLNPNLRDLPAGFTQQTLMAFGHGINATWKAWGDGLLKMGGGRRPKNNADNLLKYLGYWTDNGAAYYYNYDLSKGYAGTLQSLVDYYRRSNIPIHYLQLDSWWYYKTLTDPSGALGQPKTLTLPQGEWNRYGGLLEYKAHPFIFPDGLQEFQKNINLPFVTHNRWIDPASPYHKTYNISGLAAVDPKWWNDIIAYLKSSGVATYEQDWLDQIYAYSPAFSSNIDTGAAFLDDMAQACQSNGLTMQYCMPYPCHFLQGSRYDNLTSIRTSLDRFNPERWNNFLYTSQLAASLGIWPWVDVFNSTETNNILLSTLSAGPVGIGDLIGREDKINILKSVRADGVIVKPDAPITPLDQSYLADVRHADGPLIAGTYTDHGGLKTEYLFAFTRPETRDKKLHFTPRELGFDSPVYVYDFFHCKAKRLEPNGDYNTSLEPDTVAYYIVAPVNKCGIAFLGDSGKFVSLGKERIEMLSETASQIRCNVIFATNEDSVILHGYAPTAPLIKSQYGKTRLISYDEGTGHFTFDVKPDTKSRPKHLNGDSVRVVEIKMASKNK